MTPPKPGSDEARKQGAAVAEPQQYFTTEEAAAYLRTTAKALLMRVSRGAIQPDSWGGRGAGRKHLFSRETLDKHARGVKAA